MRMKISKQRYIYIYIYIYKRDRNLFDDLDINIIVT